LEWALACVRLADESEERRNAVEPENERFLVRKVVPLAERQGKVD